MQNDEQKTFARMNERVAATQSIRNEVERRLQDCKRRNYAEIRNYPSPITACDQQFNYLLEKQSLIAGELARWRDLFEQPRDDFALRELITEFVRSSNHLDEATKARASSCLARGT